MDYSIHDAARAGFGKARVRDRRGFAEVFKQQVERARNGGWAVDYAYAGAHGRAGLVYRSARAPTSPGGQRTRSYRPGPGQRAVRGDQRR